MALIPLQPGNYIVPFLGSTALTIGTQPWFTVANVALYKPSANRAGYVKNVGGSNQSFAAFTQFLPTTAGGDPGGYIFEVKAPFSIDGALFGAVGVVAIAPPTPDTLTIDGTVVVANETLFLAHNTAVQLSAPATLTAAFSTGSGTVHCSTDAGITWTVVPASAPGLATGANVALSFEVQHPANAAFFTTITLTY